MGSSLNVDILSYFNQGPWAHPEFDEKIVENFAIKGYLKGRGKMGAKGANGPGELYECSQKLRNYKYLKRKCKKKNP